VSWSWPIRPELIVRFGEKVVRAVEHLEALDEASERFAEDEGNFGVRCIGEPNPQRTKYLLRVDGNVDFPAIKWGVIIGDAVHCLRSALDQLASGLCTKPTAWTRFPICLTERDWIVDAPRMYWGTPPAFVAMLDQAQPYHRGDAAHTHPFAILNALWNLDKHREIPAVALNASRVTVNVTKQQGVTLGEFKPKTGVTLKHGAVIAECTIALDGSGLQPQVTVNGHVAVRVGFGEIKGASSVTAKPVGKTFRDVLLPSMSGILEDVKAVTL
jgi:hypothetical protein